MKAAKSSGERGFGREAERPSDIPRAGWRDVFSRVKQEVKRDNISIVAAGVAFYGLLSVPAMLTAIVSIFGLISDPAQIQQQMEGLSGVLPPDAQSILSEQLTRVSSQPQGALSLTLAGSILFALWTASKSVSSLITALNIAYDEQEKRGFFRLTSTSLLLTLGAVVTAIVSVALVVALPAIIGALGDQLGLSEAAKTVASVLRWPILAGVALFSIAVAYHFGPSRERPKWRWVSWGAGLATGLWLVASALFSWYVSSFGNYNETYGSLGAVVILLMWFYLTSFVVLLGAEINAEMEHQTAKDTTTGEPRPMGKRGAEMADTVGKRAS